MSFMIPAVLPLEVLRSRSLDGEKIMYNALRDQLGMDGWSFTTNIGSADPVIADRFDRVRLILWSCILTMESLL
jgi:hypothetical protein